MLSQFTIGMEGQVTKDLFLLGYVHHKVLKSSFSCWLEALQRFRSFLDSESTEAEGWQKREKGIHMGAFLKAKTLGFALKKVLFSGTYSRLPEIFVSLDRIQMENLKAFCTSVQR